MNDFTRTILLVVSVMAAIILVVTLGLELGNTGEEGLLGGNRILAAWLLGILIPLAIVGIALLLRRRRR